MQDEEYGLRRSSVASSLSDPDLNIRISRGADSCPSKGNKDQQQASVHDVALETAGIEWAASQQE